LSETVGSDVLCVSAKWARYACSRPRCWSRSTFDGFTSRWTSPRSCAASSASATCVAMASARSRASEPLAAQQLPQVGSVDDAHREVEPTVGLAGVVHRDHVRVVEAGREPRLPQQALPERLVLGEARREDLEGDVALQALVVGAVDPLGEVSQVSGHDLAARADAVFHGELAGDSGESTGSARDRVVTTSVPRRARRVLERERERAAFLAGILDAVPVAVEEAVEPLGAGALPRLGLHLAVDQRRVRGEIPDRLVPLAV